MRYEKVANAEEITAAFDQFRRVLDVEIHGKKRTHEDHEFWAMRWFPDGPDGPRDAVALGPLWDKGNARITVRPNNPSGVRGLIVTDETSMRYVAHSGRFSGTATDSRLFQANTQGDAAWIEVADEGERYLITPLDGVDDSELLENVASFVRKRFLRPIDTDVPMIDHPSPTGVRPSVNRILCGPPGTGKTFDAIREAVKTIYGTDEGTLKESSDRFRRLREQKRVEFVTFHQNYAYEDFIEGIRPVLDKSKLRYNLRDGTFKQIAKRASEDLDNRYVLIIDEINRGNIAKIFGELITLIEQSKRLGEDDEVRATLPYSQDGSFGVPANLYLIGTMNTADRGTALLDVALRRRFDFVEKMPNPDHDGIAEDIEDVDGRALLRAINGRIVERLDREHQIGHTYLMGIQTLKALKRAFQNRVVPLLQEYFYDDWEKLRGVLNDNAFITRREGAERPVFDVLPPDDDLWLDAKEYQKIYSSNSGATDGE